MNRGEVQYSTYTYAVAVVTGGGDWLIAVVVVYAVAMVGSGSGDWLTGDGGFGRQWRCGNGRQWWFVVYWFYFLSMTATWGQLPLDCGKTHSYNCYVNQDGSLQLKECCSLHNSVSKMCSVLEDQFSRMYTANHLLLIKDYVSLLGVTMRRYGFPIVALLDVLSKHRDKYHELLLSDCRKQIAEALAADKFEQMYMKKEYEYSMNVLSFQLQTSNIMPAFPFVAPFSSTVPDCCRIVRSFIEDSVSFMSHGGQFEFYDVIKKYLDRLLTEVLDGALLRVINGSMSGVTQAMQMAANMAVFERACDFFFRHAAQLSGIPLRMAERGRRQFPLTKARDAAEEMLSGLLKQKVDGFLSLIENVNWMADEPLQGGNEYVNEVIIFLETLVSTAQQILPVQVLRRILQDVLSHISEMIVGALLGESVKRFNVNAVMGLDVDIRLLESFAENEAPLLTEADANQLKSALVESRHISFVDDLS
ncbi:unnamed protein product [Fraxinus pennsylvanica]|uniref:Exocyst complex subunit EXOC6/Sec15 C-terminal domain-containing protein n=1 Tax=Fraxinus pennsylvanica TaxID=56036 RepID=A0AAD2E2S9_9LAMI|nr:unnamed protein product [Fraxinus pennsylvanica]